MKLDVPLPSPFKVAEGAATEADPSGLVFLATPDVSGPDRLSADGATIFVYDKDKEAIARTRFPAAQIQFFDSISSAPAPTGSQSAYLVKPATADTLRERWLREGMARDAIVRFALPRPQLADFIPIRLLFEIDGENGATIAPDAIDWAPRMDLVSFYEMTEARVPADNAAALLVDRDNVARVTGRPATEVTYETLAALGSRATVCIYSARAEAMRNWVRSIMPAARLRRRGQPLAHAARSIRQRSRRPNRSIPGPR